MKALRLLTLLFLVGMECVGAKAQIGYQVSLLNSATGEARANEKVTVNISLSNSEGAVFYNETKQATTNDFGVLNLTIGNKDTFEDVDFSKLPFFISVTVNGVLVGRTQILNVPVAEAAKRLVPLDKNILQGTWTYNEEFGYTKYTFNDDNICHHEYYYTNYDGSATHTNQDLKFDVEGNNIYIYSKTKLLIFRYKDGMLYSGHNPHIYSK